MEHLYRQPRRGKSACSADQGQGAQPALQCAPDVKTWFGRVLNGPGIKEAAISAAIAIDASCLPGDFHADPMDRLIVATARASSAYRS